MKYQDWLNLLTTLETANKHLYPLTLDIEATIDSDIVKVIFTAPNGKRQTDYFPACEAVAITQEVANGNLFTIIWGWMEYGALPREQTQAHLNELHAEDEPNRACDEAYLMAYE
ncbi:hypothetical protein FEK30_00590 (plasmid) [Picosynechococcus sp. PCC 11901]|uniref:hypothetical protein n=1 Tax=Picosynechococcus sp. PCC 11901 TaxID=2579791 RepID=UPI0010FBD12D|nr:hypothetical protein [Picosynechococcus sp. PCC 11901]QCS48057.1 hypothetical protein FEK30_00590 [Picosynechococcus sp. PCC 11901]